MPQQTLVKRVEILERTVDNLSGLPDRLASLESQILQFRQEVRGDLSALREEMRAGDEAIKAELRAGDEETRRGMRVLHEEVVSRIAVLSEHLSR